MWRQNHAQEQETRGVFTGVLTDGDSERPVKSSEKYPPSDLDESSGVLTTPRKLMIIVVVCDTVCSFVIDTICISGTSCTSFCKISLHEIAVHLLRQSFRDLLCSLCDVLLIRCTYHRMLCGVMPGAWHNVCTFYYPPRLMCSSRRNSSPYMPASRVNQVRRSSSVFVTWGAGACSCSCYHLNSLFLNQNHTPCQAHCVVGISLRNHGSV